MEKIYVGKLTMAHRVSNAAVTEKTELRFENGELHFDDPFKLRQEYYVVEKSELDAYMGRKEDLEKINCTPVWDAYNRLKAKVNELETENANLRDINKSLGEEYSNLVERNTKLEEELTEIKTTRTLREAYITGVEKGCESLREDRDTWKRRWNSVVTDISKSLEANGIEFTLKEIHGNGNWDVVIDIPKLNEAKKKVEDLEKKLAAAKSKEAFWRDRKEEEEDYHHYWLHTFDRAVKKAAEKGIHIGVCGNDDECNAGVVVVDNRKAEELEKQMVETFADLEKRLAATKSKETYWQHTFNRAVTQAEQKGVYIGVSGNDEECNAGVVIVDNGKANELESQIVQMEDANQKLRKRISAADERIEDLESQIVKIADANKVVVQRLDAANKEIETLDKKLCRYQHDNDFKAESVIAAKDRGDHWKRNYEELTEYWDNTYKDIVATGKKVGVKIDLKGRKPDGNIGTVYITNEKALELAYNLNNTRQTHDKKWSAMTEALKDKGVEVIYMGEQDGKPIVDVKVPGWDDDKKWVNIFSKDCADFRADKFRLERERDELKEQCDILRKDGVLKGQQYLKLKEDLNALKKEYGRVLGEFALCRKQAEEDHKKLEELKSRTLDNVEIRLSCGDIVWTYCDGSTHLSSMFDATIPADQITNGTIPKCSSCAHYMHNPSPYAHDWCYRPIPKEGGAGYIRKLNKEEVEGPACGDFKARKE